MKIKRVKIENFKSIKNIEFEFKDLSILIGENNSGKTNILKALSVFFETTVKGINEEYFFGKNITDPNNQIQITMTFDRLTDEELVAPRLARYICEKQLTVRKTVFFDSEEEKYEQKYTGLIKEPKAVHLKGSRFDEIKDRLGDVFREQNLPDYFKADSGRVTQDSYKKGRERYITEKGNEIEWDEPFFSDTQFQGFKEIAQSFLPKFRYLPAVQEASEETLYSTKNFFGQILDTMLFGAPEKIAEFVKVSEILAQTQELLNQPTQIRELEGKLLKNLQETMPSTKGVKIGIKVPAVRELVQGGTSLALNDGVETRVESKGHGLQRALILAMLRVFAEFSKSIAQTKQDIPNFIFAVEEPELYLHPHCQRIMSETLESISGIDQVIFCTHSTFFIDMSHYNSLVIVSKPDLAKGTEVLQCVREIFPPEEKSHFKMINEFDPERNEMFFAKKVVLVEGDSEKTAFPRICKMLDKNLNSKGISIIECGSKFNISFFMKVLNEFNIPYVVIHDEDPVGQDLSGEKLEEATRVFNENNKIRGALNPAIGKIEILQPNFDIVLGLSQHQIDAKGKPYAVFLKLKEISKDMIPTRLEEIVRTL